MIERTLPSRAYRSIDERTDTVAPPEATIKHYLSQIDHQDFLTARERGTRNHDRRSVVV
jgi:hypothetical protein